MCVCVYICIYIYIYIYMIVVVVLARTMFSDTSSRTVSCTPTNNATRSSNFPSVGRSSRQGLQRTSRRRPIGKISAACGPQRLDQATLDRQ